MSKPNQQLDDGESAAYAAAGEKIDLEEGADKEQEKIPRLLSYGEAYAAANMLTLDQLDKLMAQEEAKAKEEKAERSAINEATTRSFMDVSNRCKPKGEEATVISPGLEKIWREHNPTQKDNQNSLDGAHASISEVGSVKEFIEKDNTNDDAASEQNTAVAGGGGVGTTAQKFQTPRPIIASPPPALSQSPLTPPDLPPRPYPHQITPKSLNNVLTSRNITEDKPDGIPDQIGHESCETEKENGDHAQDDGKRGEAETNATEVEGVVAEKRKLNAEVETTISLSPKKARVEGTEEVTDVPTNGDSAEAVVA